MKGRYPRDYFMNPNMDKERSIEQIWDDIDAYSGEFFEDEPVFHDKIDFVVPLPPLQYKGKFTKGIFFSQGTEYVLKLFPQLQELFFATAYTMWSSYSWCDKADCYLTCYENKPRETYYKNKYPNKKDIIFIPLQDADFTNEYTLVPTPNTPKTVDVLMVASPIAVKNLPMLAKAIRAYEDKYGYSLKATLALGSAECKKLPDGSIDYSALRDDKRQILDDMNSALHGRMFDYINFEPYVSYSAMPALYSSAKCTVLTSLIEGKNRSLFESLCCDTPIIVFKDHNQWARGEHPVFFGNSGEYAPEFTPESLADTIYKVINNPQNYEARKNHLLHSGRRNFIDISTSCIPYYRENIPDFDKDKFHENIWVDLACQKNYGLSYHDFLYGRKPGLQHVKGIKNIQNLAETYLSLFGVK